MPQTFTGKEYLKLDVAGMFGLDKQTWQERLAWFNEHEPELENLTEQAEECQQRFNIDPLVL